MASWLFNQHPSCLRHLWSVYHQGAPSFFETEKSPTVPGSDCMEDARRYSNGIVHAERLVTDADMRCRATEQFHASAWPFGNMLSHQSAGFSIGTAVATAIFDLPREKVRLDVQLQEAIFNSSPEINYRLQQNRCADCMRKRSLLSGCSSYI